MAFERIAERKIREAIANGEFDVVPRDGAVDLEEYFKLPTELRLSYSILKNAGVVPEEVERLQEVDRLETAYGAATTDAERQMLAKALADARLSLDVALERARQQQR
jgi:hypothetical protein